MIFLELLQRIEVLLERVLFTHSQVHTHAHTQQCNAMQSTETQEVRVMFKKFSHMICTLVSTVVLSKVKKIFEHCVVFLLRESWLRQTVPTVMLGCLCVCVSFLTSDSLRNVLEVIAGVFELPLDTVIEQTYKNTCDVFFPTN